MGTKKQRWKRWAEQETKRADAAQRKAEDRIRNLLGGHTVFRLIVRLPNGEKITIPQAITNCFTLTEERFRGDRLYAELDVGAVGPSHTIERIP